MNKEPSMTMAAPVPKKVSKAAARLANTEIKLARWRLKAEHDRVLILADMVRKLRSGEFGVYAQPAARIIMETLLTEGFGIEDLQQTAALVDAGQAHDGATDASEADRSVGDDLDGRDAPTEVEDNASGCGERQYSHQAERFDQHARDNAAQVETLLEMVHGGRLTMLQALRPGQKACFAEPFFAGEARTIDGQDIGGTDAAIAWAFAQVARGRNVYVGIASFQKPRAEKHTSDGKSLGLKGDRTAANVTGCRVLVIDLHVEPDRKDRQGTSYPTRGDALWALDDALAATGLPRPSAIVDSGRGFQVWWILDTELLAGPWKSLAVGFKRLIGEAGLRYDPARTTDIVGVMRLPGTANFKAITPAVVRFYEINPGTVPLTTIRTIIEDRVGSVPDIQERHDGDAASWGPAARPPIVNFCGQFRLSLETGGRDDSYAVWMSLLATCRGIEDGRALAHELSRNWAGGYDPAVVDKKFDELNYPCRCETFENFRPAPCLACPSRGLIASPVQLDLNRRRVLTALQDAIYQQPRNTFFCARDLWTGPGLSTRAALGRVLRVVLDQAAKEDVLAILPKLIFFAAFRGADTGTLGDLAAAFLEENEADALANLATARAANNPAP